MIDIIFFTCFLFCGLLSFFCVSFHDEISDYIRACAEAQRKQQERFKWIDEWLKKELEKDYDAD